MGELKSPLKNSNPKSTNKILAAHIQQQVPTYRLSRIKNITCADNRLQHFSALRLRKINTHCCLEISYLNREARPHLRARMHCLMINH